MMTDAAGVSTTPAAPEAEPRLVSADGRLQVQWVNLGEGWDGDWRPDDPQDTNLLRFDLLVREGEAWVDPGAASYCTQMPAGTARETLEAALRIILNRVEAAYRSGNGHKHVLEELSWMNAAWVAEHAAEAVR
jgi:hypothetical protein